MKSQFLWNLLQILHFKMPGEVIGGHKPKGWDRLRAHREAFPADGYGPAIMRGLQRGDRVPPVERALGLHGPLQRCRVALGRTPAAVPGPARLHGRGCSEPLRRDLPA